MRISLRNSLSQLLVKIEVIFSIKGDVTSDSHNISCGRVIDSRK
jgi:hypothetical protein